MGRRVTTVLAFFALLLALVLPLEAAAATPSPAAEAPARVPGFAHAQQRVFGPSTLLTGVLKSLISSAGRNLAERGLRGSDSFGWLLAAFGLEGLFGKEDELAPIREKLDEISKQVAEVRNEIKHSDFENKIAETHPITADIDSIYKMLEELAALPAGAPTRENFARKISGEIGSKLLTAPARFNKILGSNVPLAGNLLKSASRVVHADHRFFDRESSAEIRDLYEYFATYQTELAVLLTEYFHSEPQTYAPQVVENQVREIEKNLENQEKSLKPPVPDNTVIDTKTDLMWVRAGRQAEKRPSMIDYLGVVGENTKNATWRNGLLHYVFPEQTNQASPWDVPFGGHWKLPTISEFETLISGWKGASPISWLAKEAGFDPNYLEAAGSKFWINPRDWPLGEARVHYRFFDFRTREVVKQEIAFIPARWREYFTRPSTVAIYNRHPHPGEEYWWR
jgi:hypothetical protein